MRELSKTETKEVNGGILPAVLVPAVKAMAWVGAAFVTGAAAYAGGVAACKMIREEDSDC